MRKAVFLTLTSALLAGTVSFSAANAAEGAIKARQGYFQIVKLYAGPLFGMMKGKVAYNAETAQRNADNLKALTSMSNGAMWPKGSSKAAFPGKTRAKAAIWESGSDIGEKSKAFKQAVAALAKVAGKGNDALVPAMKTLGGTCAACHKGYRHKEF